MKRDGSRGRAPPSASLRDRAASPTGLSRQAASSQSGIDWRGALSKLPGLIFDDGADPFNRCCTRIALVMLGGLLAIYVETFL